MSKYTWMGVLVGAVVGASLGLFIMSNYGGGQPLEMDPEDRSIPTDMTVFAVVCFAVVGAVAGGLWGAANYIAERRFYETEARERARHGGHDSHERWGREPPKPTIPL